MVRPLWFSMCVEVRSMLINLDDGAKYLGLQPSTLRRWVYEKRISYVKLGRRVLFRKEALDELIQKSEKLALPRKGSERK